MFATRQGGIWLQTPLAPRAGGVRGSGALAGWGQMLLNSSTGGFLLRVGKDDVKWRVLGLHRDPCHQLVPYGARGVLLYVEEKLILSLGRAFLLLWVTQFFGAQDFFQFVTFGVFFSRFWIFFSWRSVRRGGGCWWSHHLH